MGLSKGTCVIFSHSRKKLTLLGYIKICKICLKTEQTDLLLILLWWEEPMKAKVPSRVHERNQAALPLPPSFQFSSKVFHCQELN